MKVVKNSIKDLDNLFEALTYKMSGPNYCVDFEARVFQYDQSPYFNYETLNCIYEEELNLIKDRKYLIAGPVSKISFERLQQNIDRFLKLTFTDNFQGYDDPSNESILWTINPEIAKQRLATFWGIINSHFTMPPTHCFEHKPDHGSFFGGGVMWEFCYILLNDHTKEGIVIAGQAYD